MSKDNIKIGVYHCKKCGFVGYSQFIACQRCGAKQDHTIKPTKLIK